MSAVLAEPRYSMSHVARLASVHVATVWRWYLHGVRGRKLPTIAIGGRRYILAADLETFLAAGNHDRLTGKTEVQQRANNAGKLLDALGVRSHTHGSQVRGKPIQTTSGTAAVKANPRAK